MQHPKVVLFLLRVAIASVFLYAALAATLTPYNWIGYIPQFLRHIFPATILLRGFSLFQTALAIWLLSGWRVKYAAFLSALTLAGIITANITQLDILFRDYAIFFAAVALFIGEK